MPDSDLPHTQIGKVNSKRKDNNYSYTQAREWNYNSEGKLQHTKDIDFTDHRRPDLHPNPHQHRYVPNPTGGTLQRNTEAEPLVSTSDLVNDQDTQPTFHQ